MADPCCEKHGLQKLVRELADPTPLDAEMQAFVQSERCVEEWIGDTRGAHRKCTGGADCNECVWLAIFDDREAQLAAANAALDHDTLQIQMLITKREAAEAQLAVKQGDVVQLLKQRNAAEAKLRAVRDLDYHRDGCQIRRVSLCEQPGCDEFHPRACTCGLEAILTPTMPGGTNA